MRALGIYSALKTYMSKAVLKNHRQQWQGLVPRCPAPYPAAGSRAAGQGRTKGCHPCAWPRLREAQSDGVTSTAVMPTRSSLGCTSLYYLNVSCCSHITSLPHTPSHIKTVPRGRNPFLSACDPLQPLLWRVLAAA